MISISRFAMAASVVAVVLTGTATTEVVAQSASIYWPDYQKYLAPSESDSPRQAELPTDTAVASPDPALDEDKIAYLGIWDGWLCRNRIVDVKVAIEKTDPSSAVVVYAAASERIKYFSERFEAKFKNGGVIGKLNRGDKITLQIRNDGSLNIRFDKFDGSSWCTGVLSRQ